MPAALPFTLLCLFLVFLPPAFGQRLYQAELPERLENHAGYQALLAEKAALLESAKEELARARQAGEFSENTLFYLNLAVGELEEAGDGRFGQILDQFRDRAGLPAAADRLRELARRLAPIYEALGRLAHLYRFAGENMKFFPVDTAQEGIREEIRFYALPLGSTVAELGAGDGRFAAALASATPGLTYYLNEIDVLLLDELAWHVRYNPVFQQQDSRFYLVQGTVATTGLEGVSLDAVLIRNAFHHFEQPGPMLASVKASLGEHGQLLLKEKFADTCHGNCCERLLPEEELLASLEQAGFILLARRPLEDEEGHWWLLRFGLRGE